MWSKKYGYTYVKNIARKHWFVTMLLISAMFLLIVHILYKIPFPNKFFSGDLAAGDVLSFGGAIIGATATIYVLQETIHATRESEKEERAFSLRPYFLITAARKGDLPLDTPVMDISNVRLGKGWSGDITLILTVQNVGAGNAILDEIKLTQKEDENDEYTCKSLPALIVGSKQLFLIKYCKNGLLTFEILCRDVANLARYRVYGNIQIVQSGSRISIQCGVPEMERIESSS